MIVFDGSGSMAAMGFNGLDQPRIVDARDAVKRSMPDIERFRRVGLIVYGPGSKGPCSNIDLRFRPIRNSASRLITAVDGLAPAGNTPLTQAVSDAADTLREAGDSGTVVLVTDGKETCGGTPCQLASRLATDDTKITVHVIGFKVRGEFFKWNSEGSDKVKNAPTIARCLADSTGGKYLSTESTEELVSALQETLACPLIGEGPAHTKNKEI